MPGIRNLTRIHWRRVVLWIILAATSLPVHLLYNSAVFKTLASNKYLSVVVHNNFMDSDSGTTNPSPSLQMNATLGPETLRTMYNANSSSFDVWSPIECINNYAVDFLSDHSHVLVVSEQDGNDTTVVRTGDDSDYSW